MQISRRRILGSALALGAVSALPRVSFAATTLQLGQFRIDTLSDGHLVLPTSFVSPDPGVTDLLAKFGITSPQVEAPCNVTLLRDGTNTVIFDVGAGPDFMPSSGKLAAALEALGVAHEDVTHVIFTHAHPDHLWGVLDDFEEPVFANAKHMMGKREFDFWIDPGAADRLEDSRKIFAAGALRRLTVLEDSIATYDEETEILPGIYAHASFGHTPGHMALELRQGNDSCLVGGDAIGNGHVAFAAPGMVSGADQDPEAGIATRKALLDMLAVSQMPMIGYHLPDGGVGLVEKAGEAYRFVAEV